MSEELRIMEFLGRPILDGNVRGSHLGKILTYLKTEKAEIWDDTLFKLALLLGMQTRYVKDSYLKGLVLFGIIELEQIGHSQRWYWIGEKAFDGQKPLIEALIQPPPERSQEEIVQTIKEMNDLKRKPITQKIIFCSNPECNKPLPPNKVYCDENCLRRKYELIGSSGIPVKLKKENKK